MAKTTLLGSQWVEYDSVGTSTLITPDDFLGTDTQKVQAALDSMSNGGIVTLTRTYTITAPINLASTKATLIGQGMHTGLYWAASQTGPILDLSDWQNFDTGADWAGANRIGNFLIRGDSLPASFNLVTGSGKCGIKLGNVVRPWAPMSINFFDISFSGIGGPNVYSEPDVESHIHRWERIRFTEPIGSVLHNTPWYYAKGAHNNSTFTDCVASHSSPIVGWGTQTSGNVGAIGAFVFEAGSTYTPEDLVFENWTLEGVWPTSNAAFWSMQTNTTIFSNIQITDSHPITGADNTAIVRFRTATVGNFGGNEVKGGAWGEWGSVSDNNWCIDLQQSGNVVDIIRGYDGKAVRIGAGVGLCNVHVRGSVSSLNATPAIRNDSALTSNVIVDETSPLVTATTFIESATQKRLLNASKNAGLIADSSTTVVPPIRGLTGWWDVSRGLGVGYAAASASNGTAVDSLIDLSGYSQNLSSTTTKRPALTAVNGRQGLQFDGVNDVLKGPLTTTLDNEQAYLGVVVQTSSWGNFQQLVHTSESGNTRYGLGGVSSGSLEGNVQIRALPAIITPSISPKINRPVFVELISDGTSVEIWADGTLMKSVSRTTWDKIAGHNEISLGAFWGETNFFNGILCEILLGNRAPDIGERERLSRIMAQKWGATIAYTTKSIQADPMHFGAKGDGVTDDTASFNAALAASDCVSVGGGTYRIDGTIEIITRKSLTLSSGTTLQRFAAATGTSPVIRLRGQYASLVGSGWVKSEKASPLGVVQIGHAIGTDPTNILWNTVSGITIEGVKSAGNIGLLLSSNQLTLGGSGVNYANTVSGIFVRNIGIGIRFDEMVAANTVTDVHLYQVLTASYDLEGALENSIKGGFTHFSSDCTTIRLRTPGANASSYNVFTGVNSEQGGTSALYFDIGSGCSHNTVIGQVNTFLGYIDVGTSNGGILDGRVWPNSREATLAWDVSSASGVASTNVVVSGAQLGDICIVSYNQDIGSDVQITANVNSAGNVTVVARKASGTLTLSGGTLKVRVTKV